MGFQIGDRVMFRPFGGGAAPQSVMVDVVFGCSAWPSGEYGIRFRDGSVIRCPGFELYPMPKLEPLDDAPPVACGEEIRAAIRREFDQLVTFAVGDRVVYTVAAGRTATGVVIDVDPNPKQQYAYTVRDDLGCLFRGRAEQLNKIADAPALDLDALTFRARLPVASLARALYAVDHEAEIDRRSEGRAEMRDRVVDVDYPAHREEYEALAARVIAAVRA